MCPAADWDADRFDRWFHTEAGRFALAAERRLLDAVVADWPRRNQRVLEVGCGTGLFLEMLWEDGFTVAGLDSSPCMLEAARKRLGDNAELFVGNGEVLPFEDKEYDFCALWTVLEFAKDPARMLREAARVAAKGLLIGFLNRHSLYHLAHGLRWPLNPHTTLKNANWYTWPEMRAMVLINTGMKPARTRATLPGPPSTWKNSQPWQGLNSLILPPPFGGICAMRVDFMREKPLTPLYAWTTEPGIG